MCKFCFWVDQRSGPRVARSWWFVCVVVGPDHLNVLHIKSGCASNSPNSSYVLQPIRESGSRMVLPKCAKVERALNGYFFFLSPTCPTSLKIWTHNYRTCMASSAKNKSFCEVPKHVMNPRPRCPKSIKFKRYTHAQICNIESCVEKRREKTTTPNMISMIDMPVRHDIMSSGHNISGARLLTPLGVGIITTRVTKLAMCWCGCGV